MLQVMSHSFSLRAREARIGDLLATEARRTRGDQQRTRRHTQNLADKQTAHASLATLTRDFESLGGDYLKLTDAFVHTVRRLQIVERREGVLGGMFDLGTQPQPWTLYEDPATDPNGNRRRFYLRNPPIKAAYNDAMCHAVLVRKLTLRDALPVVLDGVRLESSPGDRAAIDQYLSGNGKRKSSNFHHSCRRALVQVDRMSFDALAYRQAKRVGFTAAMVPDRAPLPRPMTCERPEAWEHGTPKLWAQVADEIKAVVDPDQALEAQAQRWKENVVDRMHDLEPMPEPELPVPEGPPPIDTLLQGLGTLSGNAPTTADASWTADNAQPGDVLALRSADSEGEWWVNQVCARRERTAAGTRSGATPPPRYTLRVVDPRVDADLLGLEWTPDPCLDAFGPVFLGTASFLPAVDDDSDIAMIDDSPRGAAADAPAMAVPPNAEITPENPLYPAPNLGCDGTSHYDNTQWLCAWIFEQDMRPEAFQIQYMLAWMWRCVASHGPEGDLEKLVNFETMVNGAQARMGVPEKLQFRMCDVKRVPVDNENSNTGHLSGLGVRLNAYAKREWNECVRNGWRSGPWVPMEVCGCGLHILNIADVTASAYWRELMDLSGDWDQGEPVEIGGLNKKESWVHFVCRFFSKTMRWNYAWRSYLSTQHEDRAECARALSSRFWSRLRAGEYMYDRWEWIWEWFSGAIKAYEKKKKSAAFVLLSQMETHKALLLSHLEVVRFMQLWAHAQIGHSVSSAEVATVAHVKALRAFVAQAGVLARTPEEDDDSEESGHEARVRVFHEYLVLARVQKAELQAESKHRVADEKEADENANAVRTCRDGQTPQWRRRARSEKLGAVGHAVNVTTMESEMAAWKPSKDQHERVRLYAKALHEKHWQFNRNILEGDTEDFADAVLHTFHIERSNSTFRWVHDLNVHSSEELYRLYGRLTIEANSFGALHCSCAFILEQYYPQSVLNLCCAV